MTNLSKIIKIIMKFQEKTKKIIKIILKILKKNKKIIKDNNKNN